MLIYQMLTLPQIRTSVLLTLLDPEKHQLYVRSADRKLFSGQCQKGNPS